MTAPVTPIRFELCKTCGGTGDCQACEMVARAIYATDPKIAIALAADLSLRCTCRGLGDCQDCGGRGELEVTS